MANFASPLPTVLNYLRKAAFKALTANAHGCQLLKLPFPVVLHANYGKNAKTFPSQTMLTVLQAR